MAPLGKKGIGHQARALAILWGQRFGNVSFGFTLGQMKHLLKGDEGKGVPAYSMTQIRGCIEWLDEANAHDEAINITTPGVIRWVIQDYLDGKKVQDTWIVNGKKKGRVVKIV